MNNPNQTGSTQPIPASVTQNVNAPQQKKKLSLGFLFQSPSSLILRVGIAFVLIYAAIFVAGSTQTGGKYVPDFITAIIPLSTFLHIFGVVEIILALWILSGLLKMYSGLITASLLIVITLLNPEYFNVTFRNIAIISACLALAALKY